MAAQQKIHPADLEKGSQEATLLSRGSLRSETGDKVPPPLPPRSFPVTHSSPPRKKRSCCRCFCWTICVFVLFIVLLAATAGALYLIFQPKSPNYSVDRLRITSFNVTDGGAGSFNVSAAFNVDVTATNPNKKIGIFYEESNHLSIWYEDADLCNGKLPAFYQGHRNTTVITVELTGETAVSAAMVATLTAQQQAGGVPLIFKGSVPVRVKFGALKLWEVRFLVTCDLVVNALSAGDSVSIRSKRCGFRFRMWGRSFG